MRHQDWQPRVTPRVHCTRPVRCVHERTTRVGIRDPTARRARATPSRRQPAVGPDTETWSDQRPDADRADAPDTHIRFGARSGSRGSGRCAIWISRIRAARSCAKGGPAHRHAAGPRYTNCTGTCGSWHALHCMRHALPATYTIQASWSGLDRRRRTRVGWAASPAGPSQ